MLRYWFVLLSVFPLVFLPTYDYKKEDFKVELVAPDQAEQGSDFTVELKFTPGNVTGYTKYTESLPDGLTAEAGEIGDASFTFANGQIKIFWVNFPEKEPFSITYKIKVDPGVTMTADLGGKFSYIENNEKRAFHVPKKQIKIGTAAQLAAANEEKTETKVEARADVMRRVVSSTGNMHTIEVMIDKEGIDGFSRVQEWVPMGGKVTKLETQNASFSFVKNKARFVWMSVPEDDVITISYEVDLSGASNQDVKAIYGEFSYLVEGETVKKDILYGDQMLATEGQSENETTGGSQSGEESTSGGSQTTGSGIAAATSTTETTEEETEAESAEESTTSTAAEETTETIVEETAPPVEEEIEESTANIPDETTTQEEEVEPVDVVATETLTENETPKNTEENTPPVQTESEPATSQTTATNTDESQITPIPVPNTGVNYRVQIAAGHNIVNAAYFEKKHSWNQEFILENHEGWVKYTTGSYQVYKDARDSREVINSGGYQFDGPFVTAYNNGNRITVQEALMITRQKWFK